MTIKDNLQHIKKSLPEKVTLVAVSKTKPIEVLQEAYDAGQRIFGENKVQEMCEKYEVLPKDIQWHMIGHLQRNKVKYMAPFITLVHGVDSLKLLQEINKQALKHNRTISCLLQLKIAEEETKFGLSKEDVIDLLNSKMFQEMHNIQIEGVMGMATFTEDTNQVRKEFKRLKTIVEKLNQLPVLKSKPLTVISMGMSGDYAIAIEEGSTMVRIGSSIFGVR